MKRILCYGDSNTWGYIPGSDCERYGPDVRWTGVLQEQLGPEYRIIEMGQNGRTTSWEDPCEVVCKNGARQLPAILESQKPLDLVIIKLGTNDLKNHFNHSAAMIAHGAGFLVELVQDSDAGPGKTAPQVLLVAPAPVQEGSTFGRLFEGTAEKSVQLAAAYSEVAEEYAVPFLDAGKHATKETADAIHLDEQGHRALGEAMALKVREIL